jgi:hypothetical protein
VLDPRSLVNNACDVKVEGRGCTRHINGAWSIVDGRALVEPIEKQKVFHIGRSERLYIESKAETP